MERLVLRLEKEKNASTPNPTLFMAEDGSPMLFHLAIDDPYLDKKVKDLILEMGGMLDEDFAKLSGKTILLVDSSVYEKVRKFMRVPFKPEYVLDCAKSDKLLDLRDYLYDVDFVQDSSQALMDVVFYHIRDFNAIKNYPDDLTQVTRMARKDHFNSGFLSLPSTSGSSDSHQKATKAHVNVILKQLTSNPPRKSYNFNRRAAKKTKENKKTKKEVKSVGINTDYEVCPTKKAPKRPWESKSVASQMSEVALLSEIGSNDKVAPKKVKRSLSVQKAQKGDAEPNRKETSTSDPRLISTVGQNLSKILCKDARVDRRDDVIELSSESGGSSKENSPMKASRRQSRSEMESSPVKTVRTSTNSPKKRPIKVSPLLKEIGHASVRRSLSDFEDSPEKSTVIKRLTKIESSDSSDSDSGFKRLLRDAKKRKPTVSLSRVKLDSLKPKSPSPRTLKTSYMPKTTGQSEPTSFPQRNNKVRRKTTRNLKPKKNSEKARLAKKSTISDRKSARKTKPKNVKPKKVIKSKKVVKPKKVIKPTKIVKPKKVLKPTKVVKPEKVIKPKKVVKPKKVLNPTKSLRKISKIKTTRTKK